MILRKLSAFASILPLLLTQSLVNPLKALETKPILISQNKTCRQVNSDTSINVRNAPTGLIVGRLENADQVYIIDEVEDGWVQISYPIAGYVDAGNLTYCAGDSSSNQPSDYDNPTAANPTTVSGSNCRQVNRDQLLVRQKPNGEIVGQLTDEQQVMIANEGFNGWVPIEYPINGYVASQYLTNCENTANLPTSIREGNVSTVSGSNCRQVMSPDVPVRSKPMGDIIGKLEQNNQVSIANEGYDGWVPIESPVSGYVTSANLGNCTSLNNQ
ncbi:SH3 domain-containing protein [Crocosphaera chwakensis]|uniref:Probable enterotoxin n=1 Tax=Crocosphaera chwakensis CCY0110 TaxID=391612 RepID=A3IRG9_9CHRO|nr:SH3 domain-containing protein [Crocosphaera chwakensis]EAZ90971.1 probable enterotoxin [Crocosphaera chwakensis CCY0110]